MPSSATSAIRFLLASVAMASLAGAFVSPPHHSRAMQQQQHQHHHQHHHRQQPQAAKGFGGETKAATPRRPPRRRRPLKSAAALKRDEAAETLEKEVKAFPEYAVRAGLRRHRQGLEAGGVDRVPAHGPAGRHDLHERGCARLGALQALPAMKKEGVSSTDTASRNF